MWFYDSKMKTNRTVDHVLLLPGGIHMMDLLPVGIRMMDLFFENPDHVCFKNDK